MRAAFAVLIAALLSLPALSQVNWSGGVAYEYDGSGNVRKIGTDTYVYDTAQRLIRGSVAGSQQSYTYDSFGNRKSCQPGGGGDCQYGYQVDSATNRVQGRTYDKRGNMLQLPEGNTLEYDELGMVRQENGSGRKVYYIYTADDERIAVYEADTQLAKDAWQWTVRGLDKKPLREFTSEGASGTTNFKWAKDHVWRDGALLASRQAEAGAPGGVSTYHYHVDHLGTPRQVTSSAAVIIGRHDYLPFGPEVAGTRTDEPKLQDLKFTGHERDEARDRPPLDYMHARYYEPRLGRLLSTDPTWASADLSRPQTWNRFAYAENNPVLNTDPDGKAPQVAVGAVIGGFVGLVVGGATEIKRGYNQPVTWEGSTRRVFGAIAGGAASGAVAAACGGCNLGVQLGVGALGSAGGGILNRAIAQQPQSMSAVQTDAVAGAVGTATGQVLGAVARQVTQANVDENIVRDAIQRTTQARRSLGHVRTETSGAEASRRLQGRANAGTTASGEAAQAGTPAALPNQERKSRTSSSDD